MYKGDKKMESLPTLAEVQAQAALFDISVKEELDAWIFEGFFRYVYFRPGLRPTVELETARNRIPGDYVDAIVLLLTGSEYALKGKMLRETVRTILTRK